MANIHFLLQSQEVQDFDFMAKQECVLAVGFHLNFTKQPSLYSAIKHIKLDML